MTGFWSAFKEGLGLFLGFTVAILILMLATTGLTALGALPAAAAV